MNDLIEIENLMWDVSEHPEQYSLEIIGKAYIQIQMVKDKIKQTECVLKRAIQLKMEEINATKFSFTDNCNNERRCSLRAGSKQAVPDIEQRYKEAGYDPLELGKYEYKANWSTAKKLIAFGGDKAALLKELFIEGQPKIEIE